MASTKRHPHDAVLRALRAFGLAFPGAHPKSPWPGHLDLAVKDKTFAYPSLEGEPLSISCKLPRASRLALTMPQCSPTPYGLGKSGWVSATFASNEKPPVQLLKAWLEESYRAQAPKTLVKVLDGTASLTGARGARPLRQRRRGSTARPSARRA